MVQIMNKKMKIFSLFFLSVLFFEQNNANQEKYDQKSHHFQKVRAHLLKELDKMQNKLKEDDLASNFSLFGSLGLAGFDIITSFLLASFGGKQIDSVDMVRPITCVALGFFAKGYGALFLKPSHEKELKLIQTKIEAIDNLDTLFFKHVQDACKFANILSENLTVRSMTQAEEANEYAKSEELKKTSFNRNCSVARTSSDYQRNFIAFNKKWYADQIQEASSLEKLQEVLSDLNCSARHEVGLKESFIKHKSERFSFSRYFGNGTTV